MHASTLRLPHAVPHDWPEILAYLAVRAIPGVESAHSETYARTVVVAGQACFVRVRSAGNGVLVATIRHPNLSAVAEIEARLRQLFDLDADPAAIRAGLSRDSHLADLVMQRPGLRVPGAFDGFELGVRAILGQQVSVQAATRLAGRLVAAFGTPLESALCEPGLTRLFPTPEVLARADVAQTLGMPRARGAAIATWAQALAADPGLLALGQGLETAVSALTALRGIGPWTAQYIAMRALREPDALPPGDVGLLRALDRGAGRPSHAQLLARAETWRPWRAYAVLHLWASDAARIAEQGAGCARAGDGPK